MIQANLTVRVRHADGRTTTHRAHNTLTAAGLEHIAELLTGEATSPTLIEAANTIGLNSTTVTGLSTTLLGPILASNGVRFSGSYTPSSEVSWSGQTLAFNLNSMSESVALATVGAGDFAPPLNTTAANDELDLEWEFTVDWQGQTVPGATGSGYYIPGTNKGPVEARMFNILRGRSDLNIPTFADLSDLQLDAFRSTQVWGINVPSTLTTITTTTVTRNGAVITLEWDVPSSTEDTASARQQILIPVLRQGNARLPISSDTVDMPQGADGTTTEVRAILTVLNG